MWWTKVKAWFKGEEVKCEHLVAQFVSLAKKLAQHSEAQLQAAETAARDAELALQRKSEAEVEKAKTDAILVKVRELTGL
jgi:hypothetical protein